MSDPARVGTFEKWLSELKQLAENDCCEWIISSEPDYHRKAFDEDVSPTEELERLQKVCAWDGCGCGG